MPKLSITMPFFNEGKIVLSTVKKLKKELDGNNIDYELVLINNGSSDDTDLYIKKLVKSNKRFKRVFVEKNQGYGWGIINGLKSCTGDYVGFIDGDGQIRPKDVVSCYNYLIEHPKTQVCKGKREKKHGSIQRIISSHSFDLLFSLFFLKYIKDINAKPKVMKKELLQGFNLKSKGWFIDPEILIKSIRKKAKIESVKVVVETRTGEKKTNVKPTIIIDFIIKLIQHRIGLL